ncbi:MAG: hypothetical protein IPH61_13165 [Bacteroidetes bacterium]|nr:hypothetical protein [Bacteroidota bacterium]
MHRIFFISLFLILTASFLTKYFSESTYSIINEEGEEEKLAEMEGYGEFLFLKLADPNTGAIPQNALMHAYNTLKDRGIIKKL